jgi:hypothetical protein
MIDEWDAHELAEGEPGWHEVTENGWGAIKLWCAGPENRGRISREGDRPPVIVTVERGESVSTLETPFTAYDLDVVDSGIDNFLEDADLPPLPPLPRGYRWFVRIPAGWSGDDLEEHINSLANAALSDQSPGPKDWLRQLEPIMRDLYKTS